MQTQFGSWLGPCLTMFLFSFQWLRFPPSSAVRHAHPHRGLRRILSKYVGHASQVVDLDLSWVGDAALGRMTDANLLAFVQRFRSIRTVELYGTGPALTSAGFFQIAASSAGLTTLVLSNGAVDDAKLGSIAVGFPALRCLELSNLDFYNGTSPHFTATGLAQIAIGCPLLKRLNLYDTTVPGEALSCFSGLVEVALSVNELSGRGWLVPFAANNPGLADMQLEGAIFDEGICALATSCHMLEALHLTFADTSALRGSRMISVGKLAGGWRCDGVSVRGCPLLRTLHLSTGSCGRPSSRPDSQTISEDSLKALACSVPLLEVLHVAGQDVTDSVLQCFGAHCPNLYELNVSCCARITDVGLRYLCGIAPAPGLGSMRAGSAVAAATANVSGRLGCRTRSQTELELSTQASDQVSDVGIQHFAGTNPKLTQLYLEGCNISDRGLRWLADGCHQLQELDIAYVPFVSHANLPALCLCRIAVFWVGVLRLALSSDGSSFVPCTASSHRTCERLRRGGCGDPCGSSLCWYHGHAFWANQALHHEPTDVNQRKNTYAYNTPQKARLRPLAYLAKDSHPRSRLRFLCVATSRPTS
jgi:hypothetical protein